MGSTVFAMFDMLQFQVPEAEVIFLVTFLPAFKFAI